MAPLVEVEHLEKRFGAIAAVNDVSFTVAAGEVLGVLGPNGAGKSTMMRIIAGSLAATSGVARICGHDTRAQPRAAKACPAAASSPTSSRCSMSIPKGVPQSPMWFRAMTSWP